LPRLTRRDFQRLCDIRLGDAEALFTSRRWAGAYYLYGHAIECAIKAIIAKETRRYEFPDKKRAEGSHSHDLAALARLAGLDWETEGVGDPLFTVNWEEAKRWSEAVRYDPTLGRARAQRLREAILDRDHGVLQWLRRYS
jgi:hypothetical protein